MCIAITCAVIQCNYPSWEGPGLCTSRQKYSGVSQRNISLAERLVKLSVCTPFSSVPRKCPYLYKCMVYVVYTAFIFIFIHNHIFIYHLMTLFFFSWTAVTSRSIYISIYPKMLTAPQEDRYHMRNSYLNSKNQFLYVVNKVIKQFSLL